jgi:uncharacterized membrane protein (DUF485 family)
MKPEQFLGIISAVVGVAMGMLSVILANIYISVSVSVVAYGGAIFLFTRMMSEKKIKWIVTHSVGTFVLTWLVSWIFLFNAW